MNKAIQQAYYMKMVYHNAGRALMEENYRYHKNLVNMQYIKEVGDKITSGAVSFTDNSGCGENELFSYVADRYRNSSHIFLYQDAWSADEKLMGVYVSGVDLFRFSDYRFKFRNIHNIRLSRCYYRQGKGRHNPKKLCSMANVYFEKSEYIAKNTCL